MSSAILHFHHGATIPDSPGIAPTLKTPADLAPESESPDARVFLLAESGDAIAHAALWWTHTPTHGGEKLGAIGGFEAIDEPSAGMLLDGAVGHLRERGLRTAVGPMNGNTWRRHRFVVESDGTSPFLLEPRNPPEHPQWWRRVGFSRLSSYSSSSMSLRGLPAVPSSLRQRLARSGLIVRPLISRRYDEELRAIHAVSLRSFATNFLYTPLSEDDFVAAYQKVREKVDTDLVRIAEKDGEVCGFVFAIPDLEAAARGEKPAVIVKTLAVDPEARCAGLGSILVDEVHMLAHSKGYTEAIHALQHESNSSLKITGRHHGHMIRRYELFSLPL